MRTLLLALCVSAAVGLAAQQLPPASTFHIEANYVRVDAYATRDGMPIADLTREDFEVLEDGAPQAIEQFERIAIQSAAGAPAREPSTVRESRQAVEHPRARVFVVFLDVPHVEATVGRQLEKPLVDMLNRLLGPDDVLAVMTPDMTVRDLTFVHQTTELERTLAGLWGERDNDFRDAVEQQYAACYPGIPGDINKPASDRGIAQEMILRRRERRTLDALEDLVTFVRALREERKAILTISDGWRLFRANDALVRPIDTVVPPGQPATVDPRTGRLSTRPQDPAGATADCERDRLSLSQIDDQVKLRQITDEANRANASFYTIDPRGLVVFDEQIVPSSGVGVGHFANPTPPPTEDAARLTARNTSLRMLAENTDGIALVGASNFAPGLQRIADDLSSYYLLGYYSSHPLDGKFHAITVRVKRPGIRVRARRGYLAASASALTTNRTAPPPLATAADIEAHAISTAIESLAVTLRPTSLRLHAAATWTPAGTPTIWTVVEPARENAGPDQDWRGGGQADVLLVDRSGRTVASARAEIPAGGAAVRVPLALPSGAATGTYDVQVRARSRDSSTPLTESLAVELRAAPASTGALLLRQGPTTGNRVVPTADPRFRRRERLRVDVPTSSAVPATAQMLDRAGKVLQVPVTVSTRDEGDGSRWQTAQAVLAPLALGEYVIAMTSGNDRTLVPFRIVP